MTYYDTNFGPNLTDLDVPLPLAPPKVQVLTPDAVITASGRRKLNGSFGRDLLWNITNPADLKAITDRTGGDADSSVKAYLRCEDLIPRSATTPTYSIWNGWADQPVDGDFRAGPNRYNVKVRFRRMVLVEQLAP